MKRMLINATQQEELRVAIVDGQTLYDIDIEQPSKEQKKSNIYKGRITRIEPSLEAAFVEYGGERHGFLPLKEISSDYFVDGVNPNKATMKELLREGQEVVVQVDKEERGNKGAALTTFISLAGRYMVLMPNSPRAGGVSRRIEGDDRAALKEAMDQLNIPDDMGIIIRTAGVGRDAEELQWDLDYLLQAWKAITDAALAKPSPFLIYQESRLIIRALRDYLRADVGEILIDSDEVYNDAREFVQQVMPQNLKKLKQYKDSTPLFNRYQIESQIEGAYERTVRLPSGGSIVVDQTEALTAIDVNSARATKGGDIEETAFNTNLEAAEEAARQLRLRDLGGLVVIDFIDMGSTKHQRDVENRLANALKFDRARVQVGRISRFGLLEMSRQRLRPSLGESSQIVCPRCDGHGRMRSVESLSLSIIRLVEEQAMKDNTGQVLVQAPHEIANYLLNEKRRAVAEIEKRHDVPVIIVADEQMETPHFNVQRLRENELIEETTRPSYHRVSPRKQEVHALNKNHLNIPAMPAVTAIKPSSPAPVRPDREDLPEPVAAAPVAATPAPVPTSNDGIFARMIRFFGGGAKTAATDAKPAATSSSDKRADGRGGRNEQRRDGRGDRGDGQRRDGRGQRGDRNDRGDRAERGDRNDRQNKGAQNAAPASNRQQQPAARPDAAADAPRDAQRQESQKQREQQRREQREARQQTRPPREPRTGDAARNDQPRSTEARKDAPLRDTAAPVAGQNVVLEDTPMALTAAVVSADALHQADVADAVDTDIENGVTAAGDTPAAEGEGTPARRRRGRRGGRRRRRQDGTGGEGSSTSTAGQSELDFEDEDDDEEMTLPSAAAASAAAAAAVVESFEASSTTAPASAPVPRPAPAAESARPAAAGLAPAPAPRPRPAPAPAPAPVAAALVAASADTSVASVDAKEDAAVVATSASTSAPASTATDVKADVPAVVSAAVAPARVATAAVTPPAGAVVSTPEAAVPAQSSETAASSSTAASSAVHQASVPDEAAVRASAPAPSAPSPATPVQLPLATTPAPAADATSAVADAASAASKSAPADAQQSAPKADASAAAAPVSAASHDAAVTPPVATPAVATAPAIAAAERKVDAPSEPAKPQSAPAAATPAAVVAPQSAPAPRPAPKPASAPRADGASSSSGSASAPSPAPRASIAHAVASALYAPPLRSETPTPAAPAAAAAAHVPPESKPVAPAAVVATPLIVEEDVDAVDASTEAAEHVTETAPAKPAASTDTESRDSH